MSAESTGSTMLDALNGSVQAVHAAGHANPTGPRILGSRAMIHLVLDAHGSVLSANEAALGWLVRYHDGPAAAPAFRDLIHPDDVDHVEAVLATLRTGDARGELVTRLAEWPAPDQPTYVHLVLSLAEPGPGDDDTSTRIQVEGWDVTSLMRRIHDLEIHAHHDSLTGLANRSIFIDRLQHELVRSARTGTEVAVMYADVDDFKQVNDTYGHETGDSVLVHLSRRLSECLRPADTLARLGGDEFAVVCPDITGKEHALIIAERLTRAAAEAIVHRGSRLSVTMSIGVALTTDDDRDDPGSALLRRADAAMYALKRLRRRS